MPKKRVLFLLAALSVVASSSAHEPLQAATSTASATPANGMIAFARRVPGRDSSWTLMTINPDGTGEVAIAKDAFHPVWSPDGNELAYEVAPAGQIWVLDVDGTKRRLTAVNTRDPVWSPTARRSPTSSTRPTTASARS